MQKITLRRLKLTIMFLLKALITAVAARVFLFLIVHHYPETDFWFKGYIAFMFLYVVLLMTFLSTFHCYDIGLTHLRDLLIAYFIAIVLTNFIIYFVLSLIAKQMLGVGPLAVMLLVQWALGVILYLLSDRVYALLNPAHRAVVICSEARGELATLEKFSKLKERYEICEVIPESVGFDELVRRTEPYSVVIVGAVAHELRPRLTDHCFACGKRLFLMPTVEDIILHSARETFIGDSLVYRCANRTFSFEQLAIKRCMDIGLSLIGLVLTSPLMLLAALAIKLCDGGPVFFTQERYTRNFTRFTLIKFRSMIVNAEQNGAQFTVPGDKRITPVGRVMRATRIDELPQFFNILKGDMSLVGPRAERIENVDLYCRLMPEFRYRMKVKAGLTGYAQIYGKYNTSYEDKLKMDLLYIENCSLMRDLQLLLLTVKVLVTSDSTEGFSTNTLDGLNAPDQQEPKS